MPTAWPVVGRIGAPLSVCARAENVDASRPRCGTELGVVARERTTWLAEDEEVWGTDPPIAPPVLGRDTLDDEDDFDSYDEFGEPAAPLQRDTPADQGALVMGTPTPNNFQPI